MDKVIQHVSGSFSEMGSTFTFIAIVLLMLLIIFKEPLSELIRKVKFRQLYKRKVSDKKVKDLWSHDLFLTAESVRKKVNKIKFTTHGEYDAVKTKLLRILVNNQLDVFSKKLKEFIKLSDVDSLEGQKLKYLITDCLRSSTNVHNKATLLKFIETGVSEEDSAYLISEYDYFRDEVTEGFVERIESITTNGNYHCNYDRLSAVFEVLAMGLYLIPKDSITACNRINGKFKKYEGKI